MTVRSANGASHAHSFDVRVSDGDRAPALDEFRILAPPVNVRHVVGRQRPFRFASGRSSSPTSNGGGGGGGGGGGDDDDPRADGASAVFECAPAASGRAPPLVRWLVNGAALVPETSGVHTEQRGRRLVLSNVAHYFNDADADDESADNDDDDTATADGARDRHSAIVTCEAIAGPLKSTASARLNMIG